MKWARGNAPYLSTVLKYFIICSDLEIIYFFLLIPYHQHCSTIPENAWKPNRHSHELSLSSLQIVLCIQRNLFLEPYKLPSQSNVAKQCKEPEHRCQDFWLSVYRACLPHAWQHISDLLVSQLHLFVCLMYGSKTAVNNNNADITSETLMCYHQIQTVSWNTLKELTIKQLCGISPCPLKWTFHLLLAMVG